MLLDNQTQANLAVGKADTMNEEINLEVLPDTLTGAQFIALLYAKPVKDIIQHSPKYKMKTPKFNPVQVTEEDYLEADDSNTGWCTQCEAFVGDFCEPDASEYECPECEQKTVYGAAEALLQGMIVL